MGKLQVAPYKQGMDQATSRGPFQPHLFCDSVVWDNTGMFQKALLGTLPKYFGIHSLGGSAKRAVVMLRETETSTPRLPWVEEPLHGKYHAG